MNGAKFYRMFHPIFDEGLAHSSYVIACGRTRLAAVVDPRRDVDVYVALARQHQLTLSLAIETHIHADFVSGARELARHGAEVVAGPGAGLRFRHREARDGDLYRLGDVSLKVIHTPGHTPEHISMLVDEPGEAARVLTGDTLFVGAVGRPDLLGSARARELAGDLYVSMVDKLLSLDDSVEVHPAHGAGSLCGTSIGRERHSTIGQERRFNPMLQHRTKEAFVEAVLRDLPETPPYFAELKRVNREGPPVLDLTTAPPATPPLTAADAAVAVQAGAVLIDVRQPEVFARSYPTGAVNIGFGPKVGFWASWVVPLSATVILLADGGTPQIEETRRQLLRVGIDGVAGYVDGGFAAWRTAGLPVTQVSKMSASELHEGESTLKVTLVDVRTRPEFDAGHIPGAIHIPAGEVIGRAGTIPRDRPVATICESGYRSTLAASLLARHGIGPVSTVTGGMTAYRALQTTA